jgi:hypothetical protein
MEEICYGCVCEIKKGVSERRKLYSKSTCHLLPIITSKFRDLYSSEDIDKLLPSMESTETKEPEIYICMRCFRSLRRFYSLENERKELDKSLKSGIVKVGEWVKLQPRREISTPTRTKKRSIETTPPAAPPSKRRRGPDTPTRNIIQRIHAPGTPSVSVSF